jgi:hypothetical protein
MYGSIVGLVTNAARRPIAGATVTAMSGSGSVRATISGSDGVYSFSAVPRGDWSLTATVDGASESLGGGFMNNSGRYLALTPPINGATAATGSPYFTQQPGQKLYQWDTQLNVQYMPKDWITWWTEATFRHSNVPYWSGSGGVTPPGGNNGSPGSCVGGPADPATNNCSASDWSPDLRTRGSCRRGCAGEVLGDGMTTACACQGKCIARRSCGLGPLWNSYFLPLWIGLLAAPIRPRV